MSEDFLLAINGVPRQLEKKGLPEQSDNARFVLESESRRHLRQGMLPTVWLLDATRQAQVLPLPVFIARSATRKAKFICCRLFDTSA